MYRRRRITSGKDNRLQRQERNEITGKDDGKGMKEMSNDEGEDGLWHIDRGCGGEDDEDVIQRK